jgi:hypothetical protein
LHVDAKSTPQGVLGSDIAGIENATSNGIYFNLLITSEELKNLLCKA